MHNTDSPQSAIPLDPVLFADDADNGFASPKLAERRRGRRGYGLVLAAAAAVAILFAGALTLLPANTEPALAAVQSAAQATAQTDSGRVQVVAGFSGEDGTDLHPTAVNATVDGRYNGADVAFLVTSFEAVDGDHSTGLEELGSEFPLTETRFVDGVIYANTAEQGWIGVEVPEFIGTSISDLADPREVLTAVEELVEAEEIGPVTLTEPDGATVETTHYQSVVDLGDETLAESGWLAGMDLTSIDAEGTVTIDLYVGGDDLIRRLTVSGNATEPDDGPGSATLKVTTSFFGFGDDVSIEAPADAQMIDPLQDFEGFEGLEGLQGSPFGDREDSDLDG